MSPAVNRLPKHLQRFVVEQNYQKYTPQEHATWRYIMRQNRAFYADHAVPVYLDGLKKTGITIDRIPNIAEMDECLSQFDYGAVGVCGFIPPAIFLEFQALGIMPIATDMRTINHIGYTPAPDIVHEAAGHAPIVADPAYRRYLSKYGRIAHQAIFSEEDVRLYEAIRYLSDIKENPDVPPADIVRAQELLDAASKAVTYVSESAKVGRMGWWTIEYGLVGESDNPKIYGAGLLSSVGEGQSCLSPKVKKIPLTVHCVEQSYDITEPQPQLFVAPSLDHLPDSLDQLEATMSFRRGGAFGCATAQKARTINTIALDSGVQCGGRLESYIANHDDVEFFKFIGPTQIGAAGSQIPGQGKDYHHHGFSTPIGFWNPFPNRFPHQLNASELREIGVAAGNDAELSLVNGFVVKGRVLRVIRGLDEKLQMVVWENCTVRRGDTIYFKPEWGAFDMAVGTRVVSVFSGPPDRDAFGDYEIGFASSAPGRTSPFSEGEKSLFGIYRELQSLRTGSIPKEQLRQKLEQCAAQLLRDFPREWLAQLEVTELATALAVDGGSQLNQLFKHLDRSKATFSNEISELITKGQKLIAVQD